MQREGLSLRASSSAAQTSGHVNDTAISAQNAKWALSVYLAGNKGAEEDGCGFRSIPFAVRGQKLCTFQPKYDRYMNVVPYEENRVKLKKVGGCENDYINASYVRSKSDDLATFSYIATQGPVEETIGDFWKMVCQQKVTAVVMLCDLVEDMMLKCAKYFPITLGETIDAGDFEVRAIHGENICPGVEHRVLEVLDKSSSSSSASTPVRRRIDHFRYSDWPDHGIPESHNSMLQISKLIHEHHPCSQVVVHCSAGIGRTGTFCMIDIALRRVLSAKQALDSSHFKCIDFEGLLTELRSCRIGMVQTVEQFTFARKAILSTLEDTVARSK